MIRNRYDGIRWWHPYALAAAMVVVVGIALGFPSPAKSECLSIENMVTYMAELAEREGVEVTIWLHQDNHPAKPYTLLQWIKPSRQYEVRYFDNTKCLTPNKWGQTVHLIGYSLQLQKLLSGAAILHPPPEKPQTY